MSQLLNPERLEKELKKREQELKCLYRIALEVDSDNDPGQMLQKIAEQIRELL